MWDRELNIAKKSALAAGKLLLENQVDLSGVLSSDNKDIKLKADLESEGLIIKTISAVSEYPILSEERGKVKDFVISDDTVYWIVDPLDGSLNYSRGIPLACVSIALWKGQTPILGVVNDFNRGEVFSRVSGKPLVVNGDVVKNTNNSLSLEISNAIIGTGFPSGRKYDDSSLYEFVKKVQRYKKVRLLGSAALSLAWVSVGRLDVYSEEGIYLWDIAAGLALVDGGRASSKMSLIDGYKYFLEIKRI